MAFAGGDHRPSALGGVFGKESTTSFEVYLNLTPLMDVMSNILFFLLAAFGSTLVAVLPTTIPTRGADTATETQQEEKVNATVRADREGLTLKLDSPNLDPSVLRPYGGHFARQGADYDFASFTAALKRVKERWPASRTMILVPDDTFRFEQVVKIMDAAREYHLSDGRKVMLFDEVVLSSTPASEKAK
jgi:biopolymer transport protein ExbD